MTVKELMQDKVFTVQPDDMVDRVFFLIHYEKIRHIPVVEKNRVVGMVSDRDLYKALGPRSQRGAVAAGKDSAQLHVIPRKVRHLMRRGVVTIDPEETAFKAAAMMANKKIGALPVIKHGRLVGIITATDLLLAFSQLEEPTSKTV